MSFNETDTATAAPDSTEMSDGDDDTTDSQASWGRIFTFPPLSRFLSPPLPPPSRTLSVRPPSALPRVVSWAGA